ncbi:hypothetical protein BCR44DRAFT_1280410 [Catenaria anguillulae PL171]|uniref:Uncharacterized protein n=1 Tax=Catenaria anguillulae PL171 TaxID=765915 RepID=A0A1Y2HBG6_9FUNG|nr:hypothetical protein BCR44DRAFT_1280410 [Catenaria anguillulae PL171]
MLESLASIIVEDHSVVELAGDDVLARLTRLETYQCRGRPLTYLSKCMALQSLTLHMSVHDGPVGESAAGEGATFRFEYGRIVRVPPPSMTGSGSADMPPTQVQVVIPPGGLPELRTIELIGPNDAEKTMTDSVLVIPPGTLTALSRCTKLVQVTPRGYVWAGPAWGIANRQAPAWELVLNPGMVDQVEKANGFKMALRGLARVPWTVRPSSVTLQVPGEVDMQIMAKWIEAVAEVQVWATGFKTASGSKRCALPMSTAAGFGLADFGVNDGSVSIDERQKQWWGESKEIGAVPKLNIVYA